MCLIVFAWDTHPKYQLVLAANRDEFYERPTASAGYWEDHPQILGGRDLKAGGSWMTVSQQGMFAAVTNYRDLANIKENAVSRGALPTGFLMEEKSPVQYLNDLQQKADQYNGFNLLVADQKHMGHYSNYEGHVNMLKPGIYGLSNALLDTPWPKVASAKTKFEQLISNSFHAEELIAMMADTSVAEDDALPDTGVSKDMEKSLSAMCIRMEGYGTCCTTVITIDRAGVVDFTEKSYPVGNRKEETVNYQFEIEK